MPLLNWKQNAAPGSQRHHPGRQTLRKGPYLAHGARKPSGAILLVRRGSEAMSTKLEPLDFTLEPLDFELEPLALDVSPMALDWPEPTQDDEPFSRL